MSVQLLKVCFLVPLKAAFVLAVGVGIQVGDSKASTTVTSSNKERRMGSLCHALGRPDNKDAYTLS